MRALALTGKLTLFILFICSVSAAPSNTRTRLRRARQSILRLVAMSHDENLPALERRNVQQFLEEAVMRTRTSLKIGLEKRENLSSSCNLSRRFADDVVITLYGSQENPRLRAANLPYLHLLLGHCDPLVRMIVAEWVNETFIGEFPRTAFFPALKNPLTWPWIEALNGYYQADRPTAIGKALARLAHNAQFDPDPDAARSAKVAWSLVESELGQAQSEGLALLRKVSRLWLNEVWEIQQHWDKQRATLKAYHQELVTTGTSPAGTGSAAALLRGLKQGIDNLPPLPPCQDLLLLKNILN
jgi:hypothetical protein